MLHSSSTDEKLYLPTTTATSSPGLQRETSSPHSGPSHSEPRVGYLSATPPKLVPGRTTFLSASGGSTNDGFPFTATVLTAPLPLGPEGRSRHDDRTLAMIDDQDMS